MHSPCSKVLHARDVEMVKIYGVAAQTAQTVLASLENVFFGIINANSAVIAYFLAGFGGDDHV